MKKYLPIIDQSTRKAFVEYFECLNIDEIDYLAIGVQDLINNQSMSLMSREEWQLHFIKENYPNFDPIRRIVYTTPRNIILFNEIGEINKIGYEIMRQRRLFGIINGFVIVERHKTHNYLITFGSGYKNFDPTHFIHSKYNGIKQSMRDLKLIVESGVSSL